MTTPKYVGFNQDKHGITQLGRVVLDAWVFGLIPWTEACAGWDGGRSTARCISTIATARR